MFSRNELDELVASESRPALSIYMPTHAAGREIRQDPICLRNLLFSAKGRLGALCRPSEIDKLLAPAWRLLEDETFWRHQQKGLAIFLAPAFDCVHRLPISVPEEIVVGAHFRIRPLLPLLDDAGPFWLLTISAARTRLFRGSRWNFEEVDEISLPQGVATIRGMTEYEKTHYASPTGRHGGLAKAQSLGADPDQARKDELLDLLRRIAPPIEPFVKRCPAPVIIAAHPEIYGHFKEIAGWKEIYPAGLIENPDALPAAELHTRAYSLLEDRQRQARDAALEHLNERLSIGKATTKPEEIVKAARYARIDSLFLGGDEHVWGSFDETEDRVFAHGSPTANDMDLLDYAALMTLRHGGSVMLIDRAALPPPGLATAALRY